MAADSGGKEFGDDGGSDGGQRRWAAHQLELKLARGGDAPTAVKARELGQIVLAESAEGDLKEGGRVGIGGDDPGEDHVGPASSGCRSDRPRVRLQMYWSPDGKWILFSSNNQKLFVVHPDGTGLHQISLDISGAYYASEPAWSPDGTKIVLRLFLASTGEQHLYTVRSTGSALRQVANTQGSEEFPDWGSHPLANTKA